MKHELLCTLLIEAGKAIRRQIITSITTQTVHQLSQIYEQKTEDTLFVIDKDVEPVLFQVFEKYHHLIGNIALIAEGLSTSEHPILFPSGINENAADVRIIIDPIDGTRGLMYDKRPAFFLAGAAPNKGKLTRLSDIEVAVMVELPVSKQYLADVLWAVKGKGAHVIRENLLNGSARQLHTSPSEASSLAGGFAQLARFFPPRRDILAALEEELIQLISPSNHQALIFEDQYISSGGQLYELLMGHDRFTADIRGLLYQHLEREGIRGGHVCHPYDVCAHLIGVEAGLIITDAYGNNLDAPLTLTHTVNWVGYANSNLENIVKPVFQSLLKKYNLIT